MKTIHLLTNETKEHQIIETKLFSNEFIISIPHSGLLVPTKIKEKLNLNQSILIGTDLFTNQLYNFEQGIKINFNLNPYVINVGRNIIPDPTKPKHLQTDPFHLDSLTGEPILKEEFYEEEKQELLQHYHHYHQQLEQAIKEMKQQLGYALLFDCHSMFPIGLQNTPDAGKERADFVIGTLNQTSAHTKLISVFSENLKKTNSVAIDKPYQGGYITQKYHNPKNNIHVLQLETNKKLYLDELQPNSQIKEINSIIFQAIQATSRTAKQLFTKQL